MMGTPLTPARVQDNKTYKTHIFIKYLLHEYSTPNIEINNTTSKSGVFHSIIMSKYNNYVLILSHSQIQMKNVPSSG